MLQSIVHAPREGDPASACASKRRSFSNVSSVKETHLRAAVLDKTLYWHSASLCLFYTNMSRDAAAAQAAGCLVVLLSELEAAVTARPSLRFFVLKKPKRSLISMFNLKSKPVTHGTPRARTNPEWTVSQKPAARFTLSPDGEPRPRPSSSSSASLGPAQRTAVSTESVGTTATASLARSLPKGGVSP